MLLLGAGATIRSIQRGTASFADGDATINAVISAVNLAKTFVIITMTSGVGNPDTIGKIALRASLTSSTNLEVSRSVTPGGLMIAEWQVIEFSGSANVQQVLTTNITAASTDVAISAVDMAKTFLIMSWRSPSVQTTIGQLTDTMPRVLLTSSTNLRIIRDTPTSYGIDVATFVVELK